MEKDFTEGEAINLIGRRYRALRGYSGVSAGTIGRVVGTYRREHGFGIDVVWEGTEPVTINDSRFGGRTDGFSHSDLHLEWVGGPWDGGRAMTPLDGCCPNGCQRHVVTWQGE